MIVQCSYLIEGWLVLQIKQYTGTKIHATQKFILKGRGWTADHIQRHFSKCFLAMGFNFATYYSVSLKHLLLRFWDKNKNSHYFYCSVVGSMFVILKYLMGFNFKETECHLPKDNNSQVGLMHLETYAHNQ